jgi:hypothetical protein
MKRTETPVGLRFARHQCQFVNAAVGLVRDGQCSSARESCARSCGTDPMW